MECTKVRVVWPDRPLANATPRPAEDVAGLLKSEDRGGASFWLMLARMMYNGQANLQPRAGLQPDTQKDGLPEWAALALFGLVLLRLAELFHHRLKSF